MDRLVRALDKFIFLKNGYSLLAHVLPFSVASLLLITLSLPDDNLLLKLVQSLGKPRIWLPAALLSIVSAGVYVISVYVEVHKAYLFQGGNRLRTSGTSILFMLLCTLLAYLVLRSASPGTLTLTRIWACFLIASLSLTGIGWATPTKWIEALGIKHPDYEEAQRLVSLLTDALKSVRTKSRGSKGDVTRILAYAEKLRTELEKNVDCEPSWARPNISQARDALAFFVAEVTARFSTSDDQAFEDFASVMNCKKTSQYGDVVKALTALEAQWPDCGCNQT